MKATRIILFSTLLSSGHLFSQTAPVIQWQKSLGGSNDDEAWSINQTSDHGYIVAGASYSNDGDVTGHHGTSNHYDFWIVRLDSTGTLIWQKSLGGNQDDFAEAVEQTSDGGFIAAGFSNANGGDVSGNHGGSGDYWVVKLDADGNLLWQKCLGGSLIEQVSSIHQTSDNGFIINGYTTSNDYDVSGNHGTSTHDYWVVKIDSVGNIIWQKCLGGSSHDNGEDVSETTDSGYIISGSTGSNDGQVTGYHSGGDSWVVKLDADGNLQWQKALGGTYQEDGSMVRQTADGGYVVIGSSSSNDGDVTGHHGAVNYPNYDYWVTKLNASGNLVWQQSLGGTFTDNGSAIEEVADGGFIVSGISTSNDDDVSGHHGTEGLYSDYWVARLDTAGSVIWQESLGGFSYEGGAHALQQTNDGGFVVAGWSASNDGDVSGNHGGEDFWIVKLGSDITTNTNSVICKTSIQIYPNPASSLIQLHLPSSPTIISIFNLPGEKVKEQKVTTHEVTMEVSELPAGMYVVKAENAAVGKFVKE